MTWCGRLVSATFAAALVLPFLLGLTGLGNGTQSADASGISGVIYLANAPYPYGNAGIKDNVNRAGQPIWTIGPFGNGVIWVEINEGARGVKFEDGNDTSLCIGEDHFAVVLRTCGNATTYWSLADDANGSYFINNYRSNVEGRQYVLSAADYQNYDLLT